MARTRRKYKLLRGRYSRQENGVRVKYAPNDVILLTNEEARSDSWKDVLGRKIVPLSDYVDETESVVAFDGGDSGDDGDDGADGADTDDADDSDADDTDDSDDSVDPSEWSFLSELSAKDAIAAVEEAETVGDLLAAKKAEELGSKRKTVLSAIEDLIGEE